MITKRVVAAVAPVPDGLTVATTWLDRFLGTLLVVRVIVAVFEPFGTVKFTKFCPIGRTTNEALENVIFPGVATGTSRFTLT